MTGRGVRESVPPPLEPIDDGIADERLGLEAESDEDPTAVTRTGSLHSVDAVLDDAHRVRSGASQPGAVDAEQIFAQFKKIVADEAAPHAVRAPMTGAAAHRDYDDADATTVSAAPVPDPPDGPAASPNRARDAFVPVGTSLPFDDTMVAAHSSPGEPPYLREGMLIAGRYRLVRLLGEGGMGAVYEAEHIELGKRVALKVLAGVHARRDDSGARFLREARTASAIESENIVQVFDVGEDPVVGLYMVMELLKGSDLSQVITARGRLLPAEAAAVALQVCLALERAHAAGIVHRDLKPANVFLIRSDDGSLRVKVLDFGIAKLVRDAQTTRGVAITRSGAAVGTPQYMAPEQALALATVDHRADLYSLGALLYEAVVGQPPFAELESYEQTIVQIVTTSAPRASASVPDLLKSLDDLIAQLLSRKPFARPASANDVRAQLLALFPELESTRLLVDPTTSKLLRVALPVSDGNAAAPKVVVATGSGSGVAAPPLRAAPRTSSTVWLALGGVAALVLVTTASLMIGHRKGALIPVASSSSSAAAAAATSEQTATLVRQARQALAGGVPKLAIELASAATKDDPTSADAWLALGAAHEASGDRAAAHAAFTTCMATARGDRVRECVAAAAAAADARPPATSPPSP